MGDNLQWNHIGNSYIRKRKINYLQGREKNWASNLKKLEKRIKLNPNKVEWKDHSRNQ